MGTSGRPSAVVMTMIVALQKGTKLPEMRAGVAPHRDYGDLKNNRAGATPASGKDATSKKEGHKDDDRNVTEIVTEIVIVTETVTEIAIATGTVVSHDHAIANH